MAIDLDVLEELKCPLCGKLLTSDEYEHAAEELKARAAEEYKEESQKDTRDLEGKLQKQREEHAAEIEKLNKNNNENSRKVSDELKSWYKEQTEAIKKSYDELGMRRDKEFKELLGEKMTEYKQQLYDKNAQLQKLQSSLADIETQTIEKAKARVQNEIDERDRQINRLKEKVDELGKQLTKTQSELRGDTGEANLLKKT
jgi:DNA repair exonuclease SbcCD ATPase subunit